ncbi:PQQ-dependent sugar dehydrogenase [soil metagenome]
MFDARSGDRRPSGRRWKTAALAILALPLLACQRAPANAEAPVNAEAPPTAGESHGYRVVTLVEGLERPWAMAFLPDGDILVTERPGRLRVVRNGALVEQAVAGVPAVRATGQGGLLDVVIHPDFATNRLVYLSYSKPGPNGATTAVSRGRFENDRLTGVEEIFEARAWSEAGQHFGSRLVFDRQGYLYITVGDRGSMNRSQDRSDHAGSILRLHDDGRVPQDNPFVGQSGVLPEIYSYGHRNAQGMALHPETGRVWLNEHGPRGGDEINIVHAGRNYGWPVITHGRNYDGSQITADTARAGMESPLLHWTPSIAPSGMTFYTGSAFPNWRNSVFSGALVGQHLRRTAFDGTRAVTEESLLTDFNRRIRDVREGPDGFIYLLVDEASAPLVRLEPAG